jgi:adenosylcobinamide-GDP ribazoletransferase
MSTPYAKPTGLGAEMRKHLPKKAAGYLLLSFTALILSIETTAIIALLLASLITFALRHIMLKRINGFTGDTAGASIEIIETITLLSCTYI